MDEFSFKNILISKNFDLNPNQLSLKNPFNFLFFDSVTSGSFFYERKLDSFKNFLFYLYIYFFFSVFYNFKKLSRYNAPDLKYLRCFFSYFWQDKILTNLIQQLFQYYRAMAILFKKPYKFYTPLFLFKVKLSFFFFFKSTSSFSLYLLFFFFKRFYSYSLFYFKI